MKYQYSDYFFEFRLNTDYIIIVVHNDQKIWHNIYKLNKIIKKNPELNSIEKFKFFVNKCFYNKNIESYFEYENFEYENLKFTFYLKEN
jgi:hypothetical protein